jgi:hypothetical protein
VWQIATREKCAPPLRCCAAGAQETLLRQSCYARSFSAGELARSPDLAVRRIEIQFARLQGAKAGDDAGRRVVLVLTPRSDDLAPGGATARACTGSGQKRTCRFDCEGHGDGDFRIEPAGKDRFRFVPLGSIAVDACFDGVPAMELSPTPAHASFVLERISAADCSGAE